MRATSALGVLLFSATGSTFTNFFTLGITLGTKKSFFSPVLQHKMGLGNGRAKRYMMPIIDGIDLAVASQGLGSGSVFGHGQVDWLYCSGVWHWRSSMPWQRSDQATTPGHIRLCQKLGACPWRVILEK